ncbi:hypothetical protein J1C56_01860 [Aminobacter anthyllidis]|uniref:Uncharacterized protein n=1 Tax=Aminobacter anthyllidis TaxID=1035067 RepID=A0A9X1A6N9_9HYPH|nr:hypothetical protein [Aminobacter anthyllidis]MBT1154330.1 hypothetical protein [Aminobacter anthyllidis]
MSTSAALREIFTAGRPLVETWLEVGEQIAALRDVATMKGLDWSQVKALLKAQIQDERDDDGKGKRVKRIVEKAEFASAYADMLGLANMNEKIYFAETTADRSDGGANINMRHSGIATDLPPHDEDGVIFEDEPETATESPSGIATGSDDHSGDEIVTNAGEGHVDRSATARTPAGEEDIALTGQVETQVDAEIIDGNASLAAREDEEVAAFNHDVPVHVGDERTEQPEDGLSASGDNSEIEHSAPSSQVAASAGELSTPTSPAVFSSPAAVSPRVDDGRPDQSSDEVPSGQGGDKPRLYSGQSGQQTASAAQDRNEPVSVSGASATISEADVPDFLKRKDGCLDQAGCKVKTYSILCARCAAERVRARAA